MQPIHHLNPITILDIRNVQIVLLLDYDKPLDLFEFGFLVVEEHLLGVGYVEECPVAVDLAFSVPGEMCPNALVLWGEDDLVDGLLFQQGMNDKRAGEKHYPQDKYAHGHKPPLFEALLFAILQLNIFPVLPILILPIKQVIMSQNRRLRGGNQGACGR